MKYMFVKGLEFRVADVGREGTCIFFHSYLRFEDATKG